MYNCRRQHGAAALM